MGRTIAGVVAAVIAWMVVALAVGTLVGRVLWPEFGAASRDPLTLTTVMLAVRLGISFFASIFSGALAASIGRDGARPALAAGVVLLLFWGTYHVTMIWNQFPVWYHLTFFVSLPLLSWFGARFAPVR